MSTPEPESLAVNLFNEIGNLDLENIHRARTIHLALRRLREQQPASFITSVALVMASLKEGRPDEAINEIGRAYAIKNTSDIMTWSARADKNVLVPQLDRAAELYD